MFKYGIVSEVQKGFVKIFLDEDEIVTDWLPVLVRKSKSDKESWQLEINEHVVCLMDEHCETGVCLGAIPNDQDIPDPGEAAGKFRKRFSDGTTIEYDRNAGKLTVDVKGELIGKATGKITVNAGTDLLATATVQATIEAPAITLKGNIQVEGTLTATGALTAASIATSGSGSISSQGNLTIQGSIQATGDVVGAGKSLATHVHGGVQNGSGVTGPAQ